MMTGKVTGERAIELGFDVVAAGSSTHSLTAIIDTGFNGYLTLPRKVLAAVGAKPAGARKAELADGNTIVLDTYLVQVHWHDQTREVLALEAESHPLVGMSTLWGNRVRFEARDGGEVKIEE
jgi:clan AA aspartic protease